jgi:hypothetical protein
MTLQWTVVNGAIVLDGSPALPEGARVWVELETEDELDIAQRPAGRRSHWDRFHPVGPAPVTMRRDAGPTGTDFTQWDRVSPVTMRGREDL